MSTTKTSNQRPRRTYGLIDLVEASRGQLPTSLELYNRTVSFFLIGSFLCQNLEICLSAERFEVTTLSRMWTDVTVCYTLLLFIVYGIDRWHKHELTACTFILGIIIIARIVFFIYCMVLFLQNFDDLAPDLFGRRFYIPIWGWSLRFALTFFTLTYREQAWYLLHSLLSWITRLITIL